MAHQRIKTDKIEIATCDCQTKEEVFMIIDKVEKVIYNRITQDDLLELIRTKRKFNENKLTSFEKDWESQSDNIWDNED